MNAGEPTPEHVAAAAQWLSLLHSGEASEDQRQACDAWRDADPGHALALSRLEILWGRFEGLPASRSRRTLERVLAPSRHARVATALVLLIAASVAWQGVRQAPLWLADQRTAVGERRNMMLEDHSQLQLNSDSAVDIEFDGQRRLIDLRRGELWVEVAKDPQRPFVVRTEQGTVTALGTRFLVRREDGQTRVTVLESAIAAQPASPSSTPARVAAGQQATLYADHVEGLQTIGNADPASWTRGVLKVDDRPLLEVLDELARYRRGVLHYDRQALVGLRVSGSFPLDNTDAALNALQTSLPIRLQRFTDWLVLVKAEK
ncbi:FecR family protein [Pseudomonas sp. TH32]|jgi:transmembrane sensor|uniref:FecR domain-containing protein n=1 Tax=unclassified Pseudomonas TaxID=196821 RepID=UPI0019144DE7|nr:MULTISPECIES: FecR family protein [unclassified Pseudomonas]MBK5439839.1 FecR family protein [Pseudomonas sp. TH32]MDF3199346.1 FecR family protein [Pseudomonas sp. 1912-s]